MLEKHSGLTFNQDFYCGYSPERINPGDKEHRLAAIIALINELALILNKMGLDTEAVLKAAGSQWNFLPFRPGLVGGHCIGVDPYYLTHKARVLGYHPEIIPAGRRLNDSLGTCIVAQRVKAMTKQRIQVVGARVLVMGLTFKENCPGLRNTRVVGIVAELKDYHCEVEVYDPWVSVEEAQHEYGITPQTTLPSHAGGNGSGAGGITTPSSSPSPIINSRIWASRPSPPWANPTTSSTT